MLSRIQKQFQVIKTKTIRTPIKWDVKITLLQEQQNKCAHCQVVLLPFIYEVDHKVALSLHGSSHIGNLQILCPTCHCIKTKKDVAEYWRREAAKSHHFKTRKRKHYVPPKWKEKKTIPPPVIVRSPYFPENKSSNLKQEISTEYAKSRKTHTKTYPSSMD